jgi:molecular chaperone GrpE (heat shock protein)
LYDSNKRVLGELLRFVIQSILESLRLTETDQYRAARTRVHQAQLGAVVSLASVAEVPDIEQQKSRWKQQSFDELNKLIPVLAPKAQEAINKYVRSKRELENARNEINRSILQWSRWAAFFQVVALLFLAIGDAISRLFGK